KNKMLAYPLEFDLNMSNGITSVSENLKEKIEANFIIKQDIEVIPNFVDLNKFKAINKKSKDKLRENIHLEFDEKLLVHVSNFRPPKRVTDVIRIAKKIMDHMHVKLLMVGDGPDACKAK